MHFYTGQALCDVRKRFGYALSEKPVESIYHEFLQRLKNARSLLKDQHDRLSQAKAHKLALNESRQSLETLIENAYHAISSAVDIPSVESMITEIGSSVSHMSQRIKSLADSDNDLAKQDDSLINEQGPHIICSLRTRISCLQRRKDIATLRNKKKSAKPQVESSPCEFTPDSSVAAKAQVASSPCEFIPDPSKPAKA